MSIASSASCSATSPRIRSSTKTIGMRVFGSIGHTYAPPTGSPSFVTWCGAASSASSAYSVVPLPHTGLACSTPGSTAKRESPLCFAVNSAISSRHARFCRP